MPTPRNGGRKPGFRHAEEHRQRIKVAQLINRLQAFALGEPAPQTGKPIEMSTAQVTAAIKLIGKAVPDLAAVQLSGDEDNPVTYKVIIGASASVEEDDNGGD